MIRPYPNEAGHPANHGFLRCHRCGTWRKVLQSLEWSADGAVVTRAECADGCRPSTLPSHLDPPKTTPPKPEVLP